MIYDDTSDSNYNLVSSSNSYRQHVDIEIFLLLIPATLIPSIRNVPLSQLNLKTLLQRHPKPLWHQDLDQTAHLQPVMTSGKPLLVTHPRGSGAQADSVRDDTMVTLKVKTVADDFAVFLVHSGVICNVSPVFRAAFQGAFKEGEWKTLELPFQKFGKEAPCQCDKETPCQCDKETPCHMVNDFVFWLYRGICPSPPKEDKEYLLRYAMMYIFAEVYEILKMKGDVLTAAAHRAAKNRFTPADVSATNYVYEHTLPGDGFRRLLVCIYAYKMNLVWFQGNKMEDHYRQSPSEFVLDLVMELGRHKAAPGEPIMFEGVTFYEPRIEPKAEPKSGPSDVMDDMWNM